MAEGTGSAGVTHGAFGENLTIAGLTEADACIDDRWRAKSLPASVVQTGWYLRVLDGGELAAGSTLELIARPNPAWTIRRANGIMHARNTDAEDSLELATVPGLSASWRGDLRMRG